MGGGGGGGGEGGEVGVGGGGGEGGGSYVGRAVVKDVGMTSESVAGGNPNFWVEKLITDLQF